MENDYELIERYLRNELNEVEEKAFTEKLHKDTAFKEKFETERVIVKGTQLLSIKNSFKENDTLVAGIYVQHKAGGPKMVVKGFLNQSLDLTIFDVSGNKLFDKSQKRWMQIIWQKVIYNRHQKMLKEFFIKSTDRIGVYNFIFIENILEDNYEYFTQKHDPSRNINDNGHDIGNYCFVLCQRWSENQQDYILEIFNFNELVVVKE